MLLGINQESSFAFVVYFFGHFFYQRIVFKLISKMQSVVAVALSFSVIKILYQKGLIIRNERIRTNDAHSVFYGLSIVLFF